MLPPAEQVGILNRRGVDKPGVWRESLNFPAHQSRLGEETTRGELATPEATHVQPRNNFHLMPAVSETGQHVGNEHATPRGVFFTAEIGRASCRERVHATEGAAAVEQQGEGQTGRLTDRRVYGD